MPKAKKYKEYKEINVITSDGDYWVTIAVSLSVVPADYTSWASDWDFYGYTEVLGWDFVQVFKYNTEEDAYEGVAWLDVLSAFELEQISSIVDYQLWDLY